MVGALLKKIPCVDRTSSYGFPCPVEKRKSKLVDQTLELLYEMGKKYKYLLIL